MIQRLFVAFALTHVVFAVWPGVDLWTSRLFFDGESFPLAGSDALEWLRNVIWSASILVALGALGLWIAWLPLGGASRTPGRVWGWIAATYLLGPGLLVNGLLKAYWGRARPAQVFDGEAAFSPAFQMVDECARNCSFVSGEAAAAAALAIVPGALLWPHLDSRGRTRTFAVLVAVAAAAALMRVATGRHFLSDVIFAGFLTAFVAAALWRVMRMDEVRRAITVSGLRHDARALSARAGQLWRRSLG